MDGYRNYKQYEQITKKNRTFEANIVEKLKYLSTIQNLFHKNKYK